MRIVTEKYLDLGYPEAPDNGTWDNEGGFVGQRQRTAYVWKPGIFCGEKMLLIVDRETYEEIKLAVPSV